MSTYFNKLSENSKEFAELFEKEYRAVKIAELKQILIDIKKQYRNDPEGLKLFTIGYKEMIKGLEEGK